ncbi:integrase [Bradyrhizobium sp. GM24.11]
MAIDLSFIRTIITHAAAVHGIEVSAEEARLARVVLGHLNLVGKSKERDRRPTQNELDELIDYFETNRRQFIPMGRIVRYAVATTLRQEEICKPEWPLVDMKKRLVVIQDRKDPTEPLTKSLTITESYSTRWPARQPISQKSASSRVASLKIAISSASRAGVA